MCRCTNTNYPSMHPPHTEKVIWTREPPKHSFHTMASFPLCE